MVATANTVTGFAPPRWVFSSVDGGASMPGYARCGLGPRGGDQAALFTSPVSQGPQVASLGNLAAILDGELYDAGPVVQGAAGRENPNNQALLLLRRYQKRGERFLEELRGRFVVVVWEAERGTVLCARDPMGYYPCFFARAGRNLLISTSAQALLDHPCVSRTINRLVVLDYLLDVCERREETFYESVRRVPPGHLLHGRSEAVSLRRYWNPLPDGNAPYPREADAPARFAQGLERSVSRCLSHGRVAIFLSGGLDSVSVATFARDASRAAGLDPPHALSLVLPYPDLSEEATQKRVADRLGLTQQLVSLETASGPAGLFGTLRDLSAAFSAPVQNIWMPAYSSLALMARQRGVETILTGSGGDEWLGVTPLIVADLLRAFRFGGVWRYWKSCRRSVRVPALPLARNLVWANGFRPLARERAVRMLGAWAPRTLRWARRRRRARGKPAWLKVEPQLWHEFLRRHESSQTDPGSLEGPFGYYLGDIRRGLDHPIVSWEMEENFENASRLGVRLLHPYMDADLVDLLCALPPESLMPDGASKGLARDFLARRFPDMSFGAQKKIVVTRSMPHAVLGDMSRLRKECEEPRALTRVLGRCEGEGLDAYLAAALRSGSHRDTFRAWQIMGVEHWLRAHA